ncbi:hypothetical protein IC235_20770 [Hymenobacter sp. BT664]|uniref:Uncharacterized protein n=1 Tax=Hymenobacter montanus TaxID=2771359 RepID=A0A927BHU3_9BACT|nr:hypothetical protein [Hymenobacter montanus]MBD2770328.1 hypothetical protein [Hymenobacter montanus]
MVRSLYKADGLGGPENVWNMCQQFYHAHAHTNLAELTRADSGWPEHRRRLAQALLTNGRFMALAEYHAPATPERAGQWLGCLALVTLATAGQQATENYLDAKSLQLWLQKQVAVDQGLSAPRRVALVMAPQPAPITIKAPWWPLLLLAVMNICASSYFYQRQTVTAKVPLPAPTAKDLATSPRQVVAVPSVSLTTPQASVAKPGRARAHAALPASSAPAPNTPVALASTAPRKTSAPSSLRSLAELSTTSWPGGQQLPKQVPMPTRIQAAPTPAEPPRWFSRKMTLPKSCFTNASATPTWPTASPLPPSSFPWPSATPRSSRSAPTL